MSAPDPTSGLQGGGVQQRVSRKTFVVAGLKCIVFGLDELTPETQDVACLWLLHPRGGSQERMEPFANIMLDTWHKRTSRSTKSTKSTTSTQQRSPGSNGNQSRPWPGLIAVTFDQRNHGTRLVDDKANGAWRQGNELHAQDMFSIYHGTALDCSQLITYLPTYIFPEHEHTVATNLALGVSLGGHCVWHCLLQEPRISTGVVVVGCPDFLSLMTDRARLSKLKTYTDTDPPGKDFVGSRDFPATLLEAVNTYDPAGLFTRQTQPDQQAQTIRDRLGGKRILLLSGGADKLVPYARSKPFLDWIKGMVAPGGPAAGQVVLLDKIFDGIGHEFSRDMVTEAVRFIEDSLLEASPYPGDSVKL